MSHKIKTSVEVDGSLSASQIANATTDTDKFLVSDNGLVKYRTGDELISDLGITLDTASRLRHRVKASVAINKGQAVYAIPTQDGTNILVGLASNATEATSSKTMGLLDATVAINGFANVVTEGLIDGLNTSMANAGDSVWLGTGGNLIYGLSNKPSAPNHLVFIGIVTRVNANNGEIFVKVQNGFELNEIHDVDLKSTTPSGNDILAFEGAPVNLWKNKTIPSVLGYTPVPTTRTITINGSTQDLSANRTFSIDTGVTSFNTRTGAITLSSGDVTGALGYTPYNASNPAGYISSYTETDPTVPSHVKAITTTNISNWNTAFGWGNHASAGYVPGARTITINGTTQDLSANRSFTVTAVEVDTLATVTARGATTSTALNLNGNVNFFSQLAVENQSTFARLAFNRLTFWDWQNGGDMLVLDNNFVQASDSFRAPIFYDSNDTGFYLDPASTSNFRNLLLNNQTTINTTTPGLTSYGLTFMGGNTDQANGMTWTWGNTNAQAGIYVQSSGAYGTRMYLATTDSFATGSKTAMTIDHLGNVSLNRGRFSNGSVWINNGTDFNAYNENIRLFNAPNGVSVIAFGASGTGGTPQSSILGFSDRYEVRVGSGDQWQQRSYNGYTEINGSSRAPIFYDSNDTGYYLDPNNTTRIWKIWAGLPNGNGFSPRWDTSFYVVQSQHWYSHTGSQTMYLGESGDHVLIRGYSTADGSFRSPIFYDSNNTGYYMDPSGTSNILDLAVGDNGGSNQKIDIRYGNYGSGYGAIRFHQYGSNHQTIHSFSASWQGGGLSNTSSGAININGQNGVTFGPWNVVAGWVDNSGNAWFRADVTAFSDSRVKTNVNVIDSPIERIKKIRGVTFTRTDLEDKEKRYTGVIAQEVLEALPEAVTQDIEGTYSVAYGNLAGLFIEAIKEQQTQIEELKELVNKLINK